MRDSDREAVGGLDREPTDDEITNALRDLRRLNPAKHARIRAEIDGAIAELPVKQAASK